MRYISSFRFKSMLLPDGWDLHVWTMLSVVDRKANQIPGSARYFKKFTVTTMTWLIISTRQCMGKPLKYLTQLRL